MSNPLQDAIDTIEEFAPENLKCSDCNNPATEWHKFKPYCYPHKLAHNQPSPTNYELEQLKEQV